MKKLVSFVMIALLAMGTMAQAQTSKLSNVPSLAEKTFFRFHWGFNNWGSNPFNGLTGMSDEGYDLRTSFSSYQLSFGYNFVDTKHIEFGVGIGYESDVYKFNEPYVEYVAAANRFQSLPTTDGEMSTKFCTRYVTLPVGIAFRTGDKNFKIRLSAIPGLGYCGKHTGLKHDGSKGLDKKNLNSALNPYKLDARVDLDFGGVGVFLQVATMPVMKEGPEAYPIKFGIVL